MCVPTFLLDPLPQFIPETLYLLHIGLSKNSKNLLSTNVDVGASSRRVLLNCGPLVSCFSRNCKYWDSCVSSSSFGIPFYW